MTDREYTDRELRKTEFFMGQLAAQQKEILRLREQLSMAEGCAALSGIGVDAHSAVVEVSKQTMGKLIEKEKECSRLRAALEATICSLCTDNYEEQQAAAVIARKVLDG